MMDDVQGRADSRQIPINKVGIKDVFHPVRVKDRSGGEQHTVANFNMYVALPHNFKGTHMSRFVEVLEGFDAPLDVADLRRLGRAMLTRLSAVSGSLDRLVKKDKMTTADRDAARGRLRPRPQARPLPLRSQEAQSW